MRPAVVEKPLAFQDLQAREQQFLISRAQDPKFLPREKIEAFLDIFRENFDRYGNELNPDSMRRLMQSAVTERNKRKRLATSSRKRQESRGTSISEARRSLRPIYS